jgi:hydrogenase maturation protein HypF
VQGVGFRPFVKNLATGQNIRGSVCNKGPYVEIIAESGEPELAAFLRLLKQNAPARAAIMKVEQFSEEPQGLDGFVILISGNDEGLSYVSPDIGICPDCMRELFDKTDRRYLHPFINCTACGPRLAILDSMPYDRERTSMAHFAMCGDCETEYTDSNDRRFHAQPVCCPQCGPKLYTLGTEIGGDVIAAVREVIRQGGIAAVKGIGGFHLCCDARNGAAVARLRGLKKRPAKPFAVMAKNLPVATRECEIDSVEAGLLDSPMKPIVLLTKKASGLVCANAAPGNPKLGLMLPYAPVQLLLFDYPDGGAMTDCLVMTSGNASGAPICKDDETALSQLTPFCDIILSNDRAIRLRADDSVLTGYEGKPFMIRRSRGFAPLPFIAHRQAETPVFAAGGELKNAFCLASGDKLYLSPYVGDLTDLRSVAALDEARIRLSELLRITPRAAVCDLHPGYNSTAYTHSLGLPVLQVQHHFAHVAACMAENGLDGEMIGVAFDGTGYGTDGTVWGGEFLRVSFQGFERLGSLAPFPLQGGDLAAIQCWRPAVSLLNAACHGDTVRASKLALALGLCGETELSTVQAGLKNHVNCITSTSAGRLFDAVSALLAVKTVSTFEGEAAMALEFAVGEESAFPLETIVTAGKPFEIDIGSVIEYLVKERLAGAPAPLLAAQFHDAAAGMIAAGCKISRERTGLNRVALSGGCFQNLTLLALCEKKLQALGFEVYRHTQVPPNDGGIALGQAAIAIEHFKNHF